MHYTIFMPFNHILFDICLSLSNASLLSKCSDGTSMITRNTSVAVFNFKETFSSQCGRGRSDWKVQMDWFCWWSVVLLQAPRMFEIYIAMNLKNFQSAFSRIFFIRVVTRRANYSHSAVRECLVNVAKARYYFLKNHRCII